MILNSYLGGGFLYILQLLAACITLGNCVMYFLFMLVPWVDKHYLPLSSFIPPGKYSIIMSWLNKCTNVWMGEKINYPQPYFIFIRKKMLCGVITEILLRQTNFLTSTGALAKEKNYL